MRSNDKPYTQRFLVVIEYTCLFYLLSVVGGSDEKVNNNYRGRTYRAICWVLWTDE
jgi:hypothetical protein